MASHNKGGRDHLGPNRGAPQRGSHVPKMQPGPGHNGQAQQGSHGRAGQAPPMGDGKGSAMGGGDSDRDGD